MTEREQIPAPLPAGIDARAVLRYTLHCSHCGEPYRDPEFQSLVTWSAEQLAEIGDYIGDDDGWVLDLDGRPVVCSSCETWAWCEICGEEIRAWQDRRANVSDDGSGKEHAHVACALEAGVAGE